MDLLAFAREVFEWEIAALQNLKNRLDNSFQKAVELIQRCPGKVIVTGMGKSGAVGRKIAGTLSSTGTPALFLHPSEGLHGDLGVISKEDLLLALSQSGETQELIDILPAVKRLGVPIIAMTAGKTSTLAQYADVVLDTSVEREACPLNLAPTSSTTCMLVLGDALALTLMKASHFTEEDYARFHPGGTLGRRLILKAKDVMRTGDLLAVVSEETPVKEVLFAITRANAGAACVVDSNGVMVGLITDGDLRRAFLRGDHVLYTPAREVMTQNPVTMGPDQLAAEALRIIEEKAAQTGKKIGEIPVLDEERRPIGMVMLKDLIRAGLF